MHSAAYSEQDGKCRQRTPHAMQTGESVAFQTFRRPPAIGAYDWALAMRAI